MKRLLTFFFFCSFLLLLIQAQPVHQIKGTVIDKNSRQPLEFINVTVIGLNKGGVTNAEGHFTIEQVPPGIYRLQATAIGYKSVTTPEYILSTRNLNISIEMEENLTELEGITVTASPFRRDLESPVSLRIIGLQEIEKRKESGSQPGHLTNRTVLSRSCLFTNRLPQRLDCTWRFPFRKPFLSRRNRNSQHQPFQHARSFRWSRRYPQCRLDT